MSQLGEAIATIRGRQHGDMSSLRLFINENFPDVVKALRNVDQENTQPKRRQGFNLVKVESKKHGFLYYARFSYNGKMLPTKFNTHTNNLAEAEQFARDNKDRLVEGYLARKDGRMYTFLEEFFDKEENLCISDNIKREYKNMVHSNFIPYLKQQKITSFDQISKAMLVKYRDSLQSPALRAQTITQNTKPAKKIKTQTVNNNMKPIKKIFTFLTEKAIINSNPAENIKGLKIPAMDQKERGCYELEKIQGVFNRRWQNEELYLLCLLIYTTGMRNCEIKRICLKNIQTLDNCRFINVKESKTNNGIRLAPLHDFVFKKMTVWAKKNKKDTEALLFNHIKVKSFQKANEELAKLLKVSDEEMKGENITFYSGRHYWKTLMNAEGLGEDIEEIFMGHKVAGDVKKTYNHKNKQGKERLIKKTKQLYDILDRCVFKKQDTGAHGHESDVNTIPA